MNAPTVIVTVRDRAGRLRPVEPVPPGEAARLRVAVHKLRCERGLSIRQVQAALAAEYGLRRSLGRIHAILATRYCPECRDDLP